MVKKLRMDFKNLIALKNACITTDKFLALPIFMINLPFSNAGYKITFI